MVACFLPTDWTIAARPFQHHHRFSMPRLLALLLAAALKLAQPQKIIQLSQVANDGTILPFTTDSKAQEKCKSAGCRDKHELCKFWAEEGECKSNPDFMEEKCPVSCGTCHAKTRRRKNVEKPEETVDPKYAERVLNQVLDYGVQQTAIGKEAKGTLARIEETIRYMQDGKTLALPFDILDNCINRHEHCSFWAYSGECESNKSFMNLNCAPSCFSCNLLDADARCPPNLDAEPAIRPGDLNKVR